MPKIAISADIHCGISNKLDDCIWALKTIREYAKNHDIDVVVILGDLFHDRVNLNIKVISEVAAFFDDAKYQYNQDWLLFPGNHDMFMRHTWNINSLRPIKRLITLIDDYGLIKIGDRRFRIVPFIQHEDVFMKVIEHVGSQTKDGDILLTHIGISGAKYNSCFLMQHWNVVDFSNAPFAKIFAGHFHCHQEINNVYIPGSPIPFRFDEGMVDHGFYVLDGDAVEFINIKEGEELLGTSAPPDYITMSENNIDGTNLANCNVRVILEATRSRDELNMLRMKLEAQGALKISWMKAKEEAKEMPREQAILEPDNLFSKFVDFDQPKGLNKQLLLALNKKIVEEGFDANQDE